MLSLNGRYGHFLHGPYFTDCLNSAELPPKPFSEGMLIVMVFIHNGFIH